MTDSTRYEPSVTVSPTPVDRIALNMGSGVELPSVLRVITEGLVEDLGVAFARIWLLGPGDLCDSCYKSHLCADRTECLHLQASAGLHTRLDGQHRRVPLGALMIGQIASRREPHRTNDAWGDQRIPNKQWLKDNGLVSFAGYPLVFAGELQGVLAIFARRPLSEGELRRLPVFASQAAVAIRHAQLFAEVAELKQRLEEENAYLRAELDATHTFEDMVGGSLAFRRMLDKISAVVDTDANVLIHGETGTGKELVARAVHRLSPRADHPLIRINCAAISAGLVESELFGHEKGAFTGAVAKRMGRFELADGGTVFLDEIGELPLATQAKLLRVIQEGELERVGSSDTIAVDVRVIAATNRDLRQEVAEGRFRSDLFYRLNVFPIEVPPLREREGDVRLIAEHCVQRVGARLGKRFDGLAAESLGRMQRYTWPGNIRELQNVIERAAILGSGPLLHVPEAFDALEREGAASEGASMSLAEMERRHIERALERTGWVVEGPSGAAGVLDINPSTLRSRMKKLGISRPR